MKTKFYYQIEPHKGYIPSDKVHKNNIAFETGFYASIIGDDIKARWKDLLKYNADAHEYPYKNKNALQSLFNSINKNIEAFMANKQQQDPSQKQFYLNFNRDGIDCYVSRWNWI